MISLQLIKKILLSLLPLLVVYFFRSQNEKREHKNPLIVNKDNIEEEEIIEEEK